MRTHAWIFAILAVPLLHAASQPIQTTVTLDGTSVLFVQVNTGGVVQVSVTGTITTTGFGNGTAAGSGTIAYDGNTGNFITTGGMTITFTSGDTLTVSFEIPNSVALNNISDTAVDVTGVIANVTSGTGQLAGASGQFPNMSGTITLINHIDNGANTAIHFSGPGSITAPNYSAGSTTGLRFVPVTPCRIADTRNANGAYGGPIIAGNSTRTFNIPGSACGIPLAAAAYSLNVTVVPGGPLSYLSLWPAGTTQPTVSTLNSLDGRIKANAAIVPAGTSGGVNIYVTNAAHVVLDINGYFESGNLSDLVFYQVTPCRIADSRNPNGTFGGPVLAAGQTRSFPITASSCNIPATARAYSLNMTVVPSGPLSFLTTWPAVVVGQPLVSTLNSLTGTIVANAAIVPSGTGGAINVYVTDQTHLVIDINGYFAPPVAGGLLFYTATPCRMADTRNQPAGLFSAPALVASQARSFPLLTTPCSVPAAAQAYSLNVTVVPPASLGYVSLWPTNQSQPTVSTLNAIDGSITSNAAIVPGGNGGAISAFASSATDILFDINGYFAP